jgi:excisionase family DNA binding protein
MINHRPLRDLLRMLTIDDVARQLNVPASVIQRLVDTNALPHYRLGQHGEQIRIIQCDLADFQALLQPAEMSVAE